MRRFYIFICCWFFAFSSYADKASESKTRSLWKLLNGTNLDPNSETFSKIDESIEDGRFKNAAMIAARSPESSMVTSVVRQMVTPLAGREVNFREPPGDFVLSWMVAAIEDIDVRDLFLKEHRWSTTNSMDVTQNIAAVTEFLRTNVSDTQLANSIGSRINDYGQNYIGDMDYRIGVLTSLQYGQSIFLGGTNRRPIKKLVEDFLCVADIEQLMNFSIPDKWVGRDIPRSPGDDPLVYLNRCVGCHAGMDALRGAFAGYDFSNNQFQWANTVSGKMNHNADVFPPGRWVDDDSWEHLGWLPIATKQSQKRNLASEESEEKYYGPRPLVEMFMESPQFYRCMVQRAQKALCPKAQPTEITLSQLAYDFESKQKITGMIANVAADICLME